MSSKTGVIILPMIFGVSLWSHILRLILQFHGHPTRILNHYKGQSFKQPFFATVVSGDEKAKVDRLASRFDHEVVYQEIDALVEALKKQGCDKITLMGSSLGAVFAFEYALKYPKAVDQIIAFYPNLIFPENFIGPDNKPKLPPDLAKLNTKTLILIGDTDTKLHPDTLELIKKQTANKKNLEATIYEQAGHGFFEPTIQHFFPSPLFRPAPALASLRIVLKLIGG